MKCSSAQIFEWLLIETYYTNKLLEVQVGCLIERYIHRCEVSDYLLFDLLFSKDTQ